MNDFKIALQKVLALEGFYDCDPDDPGGETVRGIARKRHPNCPIWELVDEFKARPGFPENMRESGLLAGQVEAFYRREFWQQLKCEQMPNQELAEELFEQGVNQGRFTAARHLQRALNVLNRNQNLWADLEVDGVLGPVTVEAVRACDRNGRSPGLLTALNVLQGYRYFDIAEQNRSQEEWFNGWLGRIALVKD